MLLVNLFWFVVACVALIKSADLVVKGLTKISAYFRITEFVVGFVLIAMSTSLPELFVGISSSLKKTGELAVGTVIGANIVDAALIMGIVILLGKGMRVDIKTIRKDLWYMLLIAALPVILLMDRELSRIDGAVLLLAFVIYIVVLVSQKRIFHKLMNDHKKDGLKTAVFGFAATMIGVAVLVLSSKFVVRYATALSADLNISPLLVGLFMVALGTTLPELAFSYKAAMLKQEELVFGDIVGSVIINSSVVLGIAALIHPITAPFTAFIISAIFMLVILFVFITFAESKTGFTRQEGIALIVLYVFFLLVEFYMKGLIK